MHPTLHVGACALESCCRRKALQRRGRWWRKELSSMYSTSFLLFFPSSIFIFLSWQEAASHM